MLLGEGERGFSKGKSSKDFECVHGVWRRGGDPLNISLLDFQKDSVVPHQTLLKKSNCPEMGRKALSWVKGQEGKGWGLIVNFQVGEELAPGFPLGFMLGQVLICIFVSGVKKSWNVKSLILSMMLSCFFVVVLVFFEWSNAVVMLELQEKLHKTEWAKRKQL